MKPKNSLRSLLFAGSALLTISFTHADSATWNLNADGDWATDGNWNPAAAPGATSGTTSTDVATFGTIINAARAITVDSDRNISGINFAGNSSAYTLGGGNILLTNGGTIQTSGAGSAHTDTINSAITIQGDGGSAFFTGGSSTATRLLVLGGGVTGVSTGSNVTTLNLNGANTGGNAVNGIIGDGSGGGKLALVKSGAGQWILNNANSYSGGTEISSGTITVGNNSAFGAGKVTITGNSTIEAVYGSFPLMANELHVNGGVTLTTVGSTQFFGMTFSGAVTGSGTIQTAGSGNDANTREKLGLYSDANTFTGDLVNKGGSAIIRVNSLGDGGKLQLYTGTGGFELGTGTAAPLLFDTRQVELFGSSVIANHNATASNTITINTNLTYNGSGVRTLTLGGGNIGINTFGGNISNNGGSAVSITKVNGGTWALGGTNTYSGKTTIGSGSGTLIMKGAGAYSLNTTVEMASLGGSGSALQILNDAGGINDSVINVGGLAFANGNSSPNISLSIGNNGGATTGATVSFSSVDYLAANATAQQGPSSMTANNGYKYLFNNVSLAATPSATNWTAYLAPSTSAAQVTVAGYIRQLTGNTNSARNAIVRLDGTNANNFVTGDIQDATDTANPNWKALALNKASAGTWTLSGTNTYTGTTSVSGGLLRITGDSSAAVGAVSVTAGALGGNDGSLGGAVTVSSTGGIDLRDGSIGNLTLGSTLNITGAAGANNLCFDLGNATGTSDQLNVAGATTVTTAGAAVININQLGGFAGRTETTYTLIGGAGTLALADFNKFSLATTSAFGQSYALTNTGDDLQLVTTNVTGVLPAAFWKGGGNNWSTVSNWNTSVADDIAAGTAPDFQTNVTFNTTTPVAANLATNVLDVDFDINSLNFTNTSAVTIGGTRLLTIEATNANSNTAGFGITSTQTTVTNTITSQIGLAASQTWSVAGTTAALGGLTVSGVISDFGLSNGLTKDDTGTLTLSGANTFSGGMILKAGTLNLNTSNAALGTGTFQIGDSTGTTAVTVDSLAALSITNSVNIYQDFTYTRSANTLTQSTGAVNLLTNGTTGTKTITVGGALNTVGLTLGAVGDGGNGYGLTKAGTGTLNLARPFTYTGETTINAGVLALTSASSQSGGEIVINNGGTLLVQAGGGQTAGIAIGNNIELGGAAGSRTLQIYGSNNKVTLTGAISVTASANTTLNLIAGNSPGAVGGNNTVLGERMNLTIPGAIPDGSGGVTLGLDISMNSQTASGSYVNLSGQNTFTGPITVTYAKAAGGYLTIGGESFNNAGSNVRTNAVMGSGYLGGGNYTNTISLGANTILDYLSSANQILGGQISGAGQLLKEGTGTLTLTASNNYTGATTISTGILQLGNGSTTGALTGTASITNNANLIVNRSNTFTQATDLNGKAITGNGSFTQAGAGTTTLSLANNYTGATAVNAGTLSVTGSLGATAVIVNAGTLTGNGNFGGNVTIGSGATHALAVADQDTNQDTTIITGTLAMADSILDLTAASTPAAGEYVLATASVAITGMPTTINYNGITGTVSVDTESSPQRLLLTVTGGGSPYDTWAAGFSPADLSNKAGNNDADTLTNLQEYAFGTDPTTAFNGPIEWVANGAVTTPGSPVAVNFADPGVDFRAVFGRRKDYIAAGLTYTVQFSAGLDAWVNSVDVPTELTDDNVGDIDAVSVPYPLFIPTVNGMEKPTFFRVGVAISE